MSDIGAIEPGWWQAWHFAWKIGQPGEKSRPCHHELPFDYGYAYRATRRAARRTLD